MQILSNSNQKQISKCCIETYYAILALLPVSYYKKPDLQVYFFAETNWRTKALTKTDGPDKMQVLVGRKLW